MILISKTYTEVTPESAEHGDHSDHGFVFEDVPYTFKELVRLLRDYPESSCYPARGSTHEWVSTDYYVDDYGTYTERQESIHYSRNNPARCAKYWRWAMAATRHLQGPAR